jgi:hypothetical protein
VRCGGNARPRRIQGATRPRFRAEPPLQENGSPQRCGIRWLEYWLETLGDRGKTANWLKLSRLALASALTATPDWLKLSQPRFHHGLLGLRPRGLMPLPGRSLRNRELLPMSVWEERPRRAKGATGFLPLARRLGGAVFGVPSWVPINPANRLIR